MKRISIILPCHNEEKNILPITRSIIKNIPKKYNYEIICIDDGSMDKTQRELRKVCKRNKKIKAIIFHKNFGHQQALLAGIREARGDAIITMDADFQHPPENISEMVRHWENGFDLIQYSKTTRGNQQSSKGMVRKLGYNIWRWISNGTLVPGVSDFRLVDASIKRYVSQNTEREIFLRGLTNLVAKNPITLPYIVRNRKYGRSSYTLKMFINMFANGFISFSSKPLRIASLTGILLFVFLGLFISFDLVRALITKERIIQGWVTGVILTLAVNSILMLYLGVLGEYIGVIFKEVKNRPTYLIDKKLNIRR